MKHYQDDNSSVCVVCLESRSCTIYTAKARTVYTYSIVSMFSTEMNTCLPKWEVNMKTLAPYKLHLNPLKNRCVSVRRRRCCCCWAFSLSLSLSFHRFYVNRCCHIFAMLTFIWKWEFNKIYKRNEPKAAHTLQKKVYNNAEIWFVYVIVFSTRDEWHRIL